MPDTASPGRLSTIASAALLGGTIFTLADLFSNNHLFAGIAITLIVCHILMRWRHVRTNAKVLLLLVMRSGDELDGSLVARLVKERLSGS